MPLFLWSHLRHQHHHGAGHAGAGDHDLAARRCERLFHVGIFVRALGGDPLLFQHLFWFYSHPAVYIMILPAMGVMSEIIAVLFAKTDLSVTKFIGFSSVAIAVLGFLVWGHHMFVAGQSIYAGAGVLRAEFPGRDPVRHQGVQLDAPRFTTARSPRMRRCSTRSASSACSPWAGMTGLFLASLGTDVQLNGTYFMVAHFHYIMVGGAVMGYLGGDALLVAENFRPAVSGGLGATGGGDYFLWLQPDVFSAVRARISGHAAAICLVSAGVSILNVLSSAGASILGLGYLFPLIYFFWSMRYGPAAPSNPWSATGLEWQTPSPPPTENFHTTPVVTWEPYDFEHRPDLGLPKPERAQPDPLEAPGLEMRD